MIVTTKPRWLLLGVLVGLLVGALSWQGVIVRADIAARDKLEREALAALACQDAMIIVKAFDWCLDRAGCFFDADHALRAGEAYAYRIDYCEVKTE